MLMETEALSSAVDRDVLIKWATDRGCMDDRRDESVKATNAQMLHFDWEDRRSRQTEEEIKSILQGPAGGRCDSLGLLKVVLSGVSPAIIGNSSLVVRPAHGKEDDSASSHHQEESKSKSSGDPLKTKGDLGDKISTSRFPSSFVDAPKKSVDKVDELTTKLRDLLIPSSEDKVSQETVVQEGVLELPILVGEYKKPRDVKDRGTDTNQLRMYLVSSVKFLEAIGITGVPVYGMQTEGPIAAISAAVMKNGVCILIVYVVVGVLQRHTADRIYCTVRPPLRAADD